MSCADMVIVFSGFRSDELKAQIEEEGGKVAASLVKSATHLLVKKDSKPSKKLDEAKERGISIVDLYDFVDEHDLDFTPKPAKATKGKSSASDDEEEDEEPAIKLKASTYTSSHKVTKSIAQPKAKPKKAAPPPKKDAYEKAKDIIMKHMPKDDMADFILNVPRENVPAYFIAAAKRVINMIVSDADNADNEDLDSLCYYYKLSDYSANPTWKSVNTIVHKLSQITFSDDEE